MISARPHDGLSDASDIHIGIRLTRATEPSRDAVADDVNDA